jgi:hypothetical protein
MIATVGRGIPLQDMADEAVAIGEKACNGAIRRNCCDGLSPLISVYTNRRHR